MILKTTEKVNEVMAQIKERKATIDNKVIQLQEESSILTNEKNDLRVELVKAELDNNNELKDKIGEEIKKRTNEITEIENKIKAYNQYSNNYNVESEEVLKIASKEYVEDRKAYTDNLVKKIDKSKKDIEELNNKIKEKENELNQFNNALSNGSYDNVGKEVLKIVPYMSLDKQNEIKEYIESIPKEYTNLRDEDEKIKMFLEHNYKNLDKAPKKKVSILDKYFKKSEEVK